MPKAERTPDVDLIVLLDTVVVGGIHNKQYKTGEHVDIYWEGNPWVEVVPKDKERKVTVVPLSYLKKMDLLR